ncbi:MAG: MFS transporter [Methylobacteriaceae bacterium]|nr:MFS transporter [Methylobacteriaceae bacterium]
MIVLVYLAFVSLGLPDGVLGIAWPSIRTEYGLAQASLGILLVGAGPGYFLSGIMVGRVLGRLGLVRTLVASTALVALGLAAFALALPWPLPILALGIAGLGSGTIDAGINAYAAARFSARKVNWLHACYSVGATVGPTLMTLVLSAGLGWRVGYAILATLLAGLALLFAATGSAWRAEAIPAIVRVAPRKAPWAALKHPLVPVQTALFFTYTGVEATLGAWAFTTLHEERGAPAALAGAAVSAYFGAILAGRVLLGAAVDVIGADRLVRLGTLGTLAGALLFAAGPAPLAYLGLVLAGLALAPIFPTLISRTAERLAPDIAIHAVGFKVSAAMVGSAALPIATGLAAQFLGLGAVGPIVVGTAIALLALHEALLRLARRHALDSPDVRFALR